LASALTSVVTIEDETGHGSGCVLSSDGFILTNHHVVLDTQLVHTVHFQDGTSLEAEIVRYHPLYDLALLKVDTTGLVPFRADLRLETVEIGDDVFAMGTPYDVDLGASVTRGIVSAIRKDGKRNLIQTDVSISPGNSGGALVRADGTLIGIVNEKIMELGVEGIGFAIPLHFIEDALMVRYGR
jgi:S1-C subfamily serine protease